MQATIWGIKVTLIYLTENDYNKIMMETVNREVHDIIRLGEHIIIPQELTGVMTRFDSIYSKRMYHSLTNLYNSGGGK